MSRIVAIIQARTDSARFPKKVLADVIGKPMIVHLVERVKKSNDLAQKLAEDYAAKGDKKKGDKGGKDKGGDKKDKKDK